MQIQINPADIETSEPIKERVQHEIEQAMGPWSDRVTRVEVHLHDDDGPKESDNDKRCVMEVRLAGRQPMAVEDSAGDLYTAIHNAADKLRKIVGRAVEREREH